MADVLFMLLTLAFFALAAGLVYACDRVMGAEPAAAADTDGTAVVHEDVAA